MKHSTWVRLDRLMRSLHMYTGLTLVPWMVVYAASAFCLNHQQWFAANLKIEPPRWEVVREIDSVPDEAFPGAPEEQARAILEYLELDGAHRIQGKPKPDQMVIFRISGSGHYRITWHRHRSLLVVEKQHPFSFYRLLHFLHFRHGYRQPYLAHIVWAVVVDATCISIGFWVVSGIYIWARRPRKRLLGGICAVLGSLLFVGLAVLLCM